MHLSHWGTHRNVCFLIVLFEVLIPKRLQSHPSLSFLSWKFFKIYFGNQVLDHILSGAYCSLRSQEDPAALLHPILRMWTLPYGGCQEAWLLGAAEATNMQKFVFSDYRQVSRSRQKSATETWHRCSHLRCLIFHGFFLPYELHMALPPLSLQLKGILALIC